MLKVHRGAYFLSNLHLLTGLVGLMMLPHSLPVVSFNVFDRPNLEEYLTSVMKAGEGREQIIRTHLKDID